MKSGITRPVAAFMLALTVPAAISVGTFIPAGAEETSLWSPHHWFGHNQTVTEIGQVDKAGAKMAEKARKEAEKAQREAKIAQEKADLAANRAHDLALAEAMRAEAHAKKARQAADALRPSTAASTQSTLNEPVSETENARIVPSNVPSPSSTSSETTSTSESESATSQQTPTRNPITPQHHLWKPTGWFKPGDPATTIKTEDTQTPGNSSHKGTSNKEISPSDNKQTFDHTTPWNPLTWFGNGSKTETTTNKVIPASDTINAAAIADTSTGNAPVIQAEKAQAAIIETEKGNISIELYPDQAPLTVANFAKLANDGFYGKFNMKFHRVIPGFVIQTGDPTGTGAGGSKQTVPLEVKNKLSHNAKGMVAMARGADPNSATSQFYITLTPQTVLDGKYAVFGKVVGGMEILDKIEKDNMLYGVRIVTPDSLTRDTQPEKKHFFSSLL